MRGIRTLASLLDQQASIFRTQLAGVYEGGVDPIHDARVATRRIRELLALVPVIPGREKEDDLAKAYKKIGRALGRVRDIDVQLALIKGLENHTPQAAPALVIVRQDHERKRLTKTRRLIKTLERIDVDRVLDVVSDGHPTGLRKRLTANGWRRQLRQLVIERARDAVAAIAHATGVYFPRRMHGARIALKRVRYAAEIAEATGLGDTQPAIKTLRKGQEILGELHDRQTLANTLLRYARNDNVKRTQIELVHEVLEREVMQLHAEYLERRPSLRDACVALEQAASRVWRPGPAVVMGAAVAVSGIVCGQYALTARTEPSESRGSGAHQDAVNRSRYRLVPTV